MTISESPDDGDVVYLIRYPLPVGSNLTDLVAAPVLIYTANDRIVEDSEICKPC